MKKYKRISFKGWAIIRLMRLVALIFLTALNSFALEGKVIRVADGDTLTVLTHGERRVKIRLQGIDAPEYKQAYGKQSGHVLRKKVNGKRVRIQENGEDRYGRTLGDVYFGERWINLEMVQEGWAWHYKKYSKDKLLARAEIEARKSKRGLWAGSNPVSPWESKKTGTETYVPVP